MSVANVGSQWSGGALQFYNAITGGKLLTISPDGVAIASGTATATSGAATLNAQMGVVTSESLTTTEGNLYTLTLTNSAIQSTSLVFATICNGTNTGGLPEIATVTPGNGLVTIVVKNAGGSAFNGTIKVGFLAINPA